MVSLCEIELICQHLTFGVGMTETCTTITAFLADNRTGRIGSAGRLLPGIVAKVVKPDGSLAKEGEEGELVIQGPSMSLRYLDNPTAYVPFFLLAIRSCF